MDKGTKIALHDQISALEFLPNRTPTMSFTGGAEKFFAEISAYRDGAVYVGYYSGSSEWERHPQGDEIVMVLGGETTVVLLVNGTEERKCLKANEMIVVPCNTWHRFEASIDLKVMTVTPQPTDHSLEFPSV